MSIDNLNIDLLLIGSTSVTKHWPFGEIYPSDSSIPAVSQKVNNCLEKSSTKFILFWDNNIELPEATVLNHLVHQAGDIYHAGLKLGTPGAPQMIDFVAPTWMFACDPDSTTEATSWKISLRACLVRVDVIRQLGFIKTEFQTIEAAALDWGLRCIQNGVFIRHCPFLISSDVQTETIKHSIPLDDELRIIYYAFGRKWTIWAALRSVISFYKDPLHTIRSLSKIIGAPPGFMPKPYDSRIHNLTTRTELSEGLHRVSVVIPTIDRYEYLYNLLTQLAQQTCLPHEVLIVDQTETEKRKPDFYLHFPSLPLKVFFLDRSGQCSSRNFGITAASGNLILLLDDDVEISPEFIQQHINNFYNNEIDASCGEIDEIGSNRISDELLNLRASSVFPAGNSMVSCKSLARSGLFDLAYEHGPRADGDLGMRLYLSGARMLLDPEIRVLHHHAPRGGLRAHKARRITYASSRRSLLQRDLPSVTELYLVRRYFNPRQVREHLWLSVVGTFSLHGSRARQVVKILISALLLPHTLWQLWRRVRQAQDMLGHYPQIPTYPAQVDPL